MAKWHFLLLAKRLSKIYASGDGHYCDYHIYRTSTYIIYNGALTGAALSASIQVGAR